MPVVRKVITKKDAVAEAFYISGILEKDPDHPAWQTINLAWCDIEWKGKWKVTDYLIEGSGFEVSAGRWKHLDGRIRDARSEVSNPLGFAAFCVEHFPLREMSKVWSARLSDEKLIVGTLERPIRRWFAMPTSPSVPEIVVAIREATVLARLAA